MATQSSRHEELGLKKRQNIVSTIQVIGQPYTEFSRMLDNN